MKKKNSFLILMGLGLALAQSAGAQTAAITYQGKLADNGNPDNGNYDLNFRVYDALTGGNQLPTDGPVSLWYNSSNSKWEIYNEDLTAMPVNTSFNVLIIKP